MGRGLGYAVRGRAGKKPVWKAAMASPGVWQQRNAHTRFAASDPH